MSKWNVGPKNGFWKGGRSLASNGYILIRVGTGHHLADVRGYAYEHRIVAEKKIGRKLRKREQVHHINGDKTDNRPENIEVLKSAFHHRVLHRKLDSGRRLPDSKNPRITCACGCGKKFRAYDNSGRPRMFVSGHNPPDRSAQEHFLMTCGIGSRLTEVAEKTGQSLQACKCMASKLVAAGKLERISRGIYGRTHWHPVV